jgi:hypothetical protein
MMNWRVCEKERSSRNETYYAANRKVVRLLEFSIDSNPSSTMAAQPLTEMSTRNLPGGKGQSARKADSLIAICEPIV